MLRRMRPQPAEYGRVYHNGHKTDNAKEIIFRAAIALHLPILYHFSGFAAVVLAKAKRLLGAETQDAPSEMPARLKRRIHTAVMIAATINVA